MTIEHKANKHVVATNPDSNLGAPLNDVPGKRSDLPEYTDGETENQTRDKAVRWLNK
jgi:hypothetical protein